MKRTMLLLSISVLATLILGWVNLAEAQEPGKVYRIGLLGQGPSATYSYRFKAFRQELHKRGYVEGRNIHYQYRYAGGKRDRLPSLADELVQLTVDVIVTTGTPSTRAAMQASRTIPIVMNAANPVDTGLVASYARPGGNVTGMTVTSGPEFYGKRLELLKEVAPSASLIGILFRAGAVSARVSIRFMQATAPQMGITVLPVGVGGSNDVARALAVIRKERPEALLVFPQSGISKRQIAEFAIVNRIPALYTNEGSVKVGGLMAYAVNFPDLARRKARFVDQILKGAKPADLPVEVPKKFDLIINLKTAKKMGLTIPPSLLYRADKVIK